MSGRLRGKFIDFPWLSPHTYKVFCKLCGLTVDHKFQAKNARVTEAHEILGGKAIILRTGTSGDVWQFRMWVSEEHKYVRKTLKTRDYIMTLLLGEVGSLEVAIWPKF
jgi:hypothetical protein